MKVCGNGRTSDMRKSVIFSDSHDIYYTWGKTVNAPKDMQQREWEFLLQHNPESDVLFFPHPKKEFDDRHEEELWKESSVREINNRYRNNRRIIFHAFLWSYNSIREMASLLKHQGFSSVQITPCQGVKNNSGEFWTYYQPLGQKFYNNPLGTKEEFISMCRVLHKNGLEIIMDVIFRHVAGNDRGELIPHEKVDKDILKYVLSDKAECDNYQDRWKYTNLCTGMPMCNIWDENYQQECRNFIQNLMFLGVDGLRIDQLKHYPVDHEGCSFLKNVLQPYEDKLYMYGEVIDCPVHINDMYLTY